MKSLCLLTTKTWKATKNANIRVVCGVMVHPRSSATSRFDRAHMTSYSTLIETIRLSCTIFELLCIFRRKWPIFTHPICICRPSRGLSRSNFTMIFGITKLNHGAIVWRYLHDPTFSRFDTITECDRHTHRQTDRHMTMAYTAISIASHGKKQDFRFSNIKTKYKRPRLKPPFLFLTILEAKTQSLQTISWIKSMVSGPRQNHNLCLHFYFSHK